MQLSPLEPPLGAMVQNDKSPSRTQPHMEGEAEKDAMYLEITETLQQKNIL